MGKYRKAIQIGIFAIVIVIAGLTIANNLFFKEPAQRLIKAGESARSFELPSLDGSSIKLAQYDGKTVLLNFWASWCEPCRQEMPDLQAQYDKWRDQGVVVLGINVAENKVTAGAYVQQLGLNFPVVLDQNQDVRKKYGVYNYPSSVFIGADGKVGKVIEGQMNAAMIDNVLTELTAKAKGKGVRS
ncbi:redoxin domain-containing protein [Paenibacillus cymbidii]|uniref:redoxin domain-containing protein n=1 Tax=Paenibacillus cymbidii TaxID=1639034 RepID=UPI001080A957|nr:redoxin domain-containing protein [Paenibacillus cymbidii]